MVKVKLLQRTIYWNKWDVIEVDNDTIENYGSDIMVKLGSKDNSNEVEERVKDTSISEGEVKTTAMKSKKK
jgi:hypothetical protein